MRFVRFVMAVSISLLRRSLREEGTQLHHTRGVDLAQLFDTSTRVLLLGLVFFLLPPLCGFSLFSFLIIDSAAFARNVVRKRT